MDRLNAQINHPMGLNTEAVVALAVAGHQEHENIFRTLQVYGLQKTKMAIVFGTVMPANMKLFFMLTGLQVVIPKKLFKKLNGLGSNIQMSR